jgi:hypothetical protein
MWLLEQTRYGALAALFLAALLEVDLLNAGYVAFFLAFVTWPWFFRRGWLLLIVYAEVVLVLLFIWQWHWLHGVQSQLVGLVHFVSPWRGFALHAVVLMLAVLQYRLARNLSRGYIFFSPERIEKRRTVREEMAWMPQAFRAGLDAVALNVDKYSLFVTYVTMLLVGFLSRLGLISLMYILFAFVCLVVHMRATKPRRLIRPLWPAAIAFCLLLLLVRYVYQYDAVNKAIQNAWPSSWNRYITLEDIGLRVAGSGFGKLFVALLGNSLVLLMCALQQRANRTATKARDERAQGLLEEFERAPRWFVRTRLFLQRVAILHASKATSLGLLILGLSHAHAIHLPYVLLPLITMGLPRMTDHVGLPLLIYLQLEIVAQYIFHLSFFKADEWTEWLGLRRYESVWDVVSRHLVLLFLILLQSTLISSSPCLVAFS